MPRFSSFNYNGLHHEVPKLMVAFDTETTGLPKTDQRTGYTDIPEPTSYGLLAYRDGKQHGTKHHFLVNPTKEIDPTAERISGWSNSSLDNSYRGAVGVTDTSNNKFNPALHPKVGINKMMQILSHYQKQGAVFVGQNLGYDYDVLEGTYRKLHGADIRTSGFDIDHAKKRTIDTMHHDLLIEPKDPNKPDSMRSRSLTALCGHYGVKPGGHAALNDAEATAEVFLKQVERNRKRTSL